LIVRVENAVSSIAEKDKHSKACCGNSDHNLGRRLPSSSSVRTNFLRGLGRSGGSREPTKTAEEKAGWIAYAAFIAWLQFLQAKVSSQGHYRRKTGVLIRLLCAALCLALSLGSAGAGDFPQAEQTDWLAKDFRFHTGETMPELRLHYSTIGAASGEPVLILHGTSGSGTGLLSSEFGGELFGPGQPLDGSKYYIILPDAIGHGKSAKPSDGLRTKFPSYNYDDMVEAQYRLVSEGLRLRHLRLVLGFSMHTWLWGEKYPGFMDNLAPMASQPAACPAAIG
jgi:hypothetical protein